LTSKNGVIEIKEKEKNIEKDKKVKCENNGEVCN